LINSSAKTLTRLLPEALSAAAAGSVSLSPNAHRCSTVSQARTARLCVQTARYSSAPIRDTATQKGCQYNGTLPHNHVSAAGDQLPLCTSSYSPASLSGFVQVKTHRICERPRPGLKGTWVKGGGSAGQDRQHHRHFAAGLSNKRRISTRRLQCSYVRRRLQKLASSPPIQQLLQPEAITSGHFGSGHAPPSGSGHQRQQCSLAG
jgi:hypothetical protein